MFCTTLGLIWLVDVMMYLLAAYAPALSARNNAAHAITMDADGRRLILLSMIGAPFCRFPKPSIISLAACQGSVFSSEQNPHSRGRAGFTKSTPHLLQIRILLSARRLAANFSLFADAHLAYSRLAQASQ
jgi:hypothetical protein